MGTPQQIAPESLRVRWEFEDEIADLAQECLDDFRTASRPDRKLAATQRLSAERQH
jgi:hypothetical protein